MFQMEQLYDHDLKINTFVAKKLASDLNATTMGVERLYGMDVYVTYRLLVALLGYENNQTGLNLTHSQDKNFIQVIVPWSGLACVHTISE